MSRPVEWRLGLGWGVVPMVGLWGGFRSLGAERTGDGAARAAEWKPWGVALAPPLVQRATATTAAAPAAMTAMATAWSRLRSRVRDRPWARRTSRVSTAGGARPSSAWLSALSTSPRDRAASAEESGRSLSTQSSSWGLGWPPSRGTSSRMELTCVRTVVQARRAALPRARKRGRKALAESIPLELLHTRGQGALRRAAREFQGRTRARIVTPPYGVAPWQRGGCLKGRRLLAASSEGLDVGSRAVVFACRGVLWLCLSAGEPWKAGGGPEWVRSTWWWWAA